MTTIKQLTIKSILGNKNHAKDILVYQERKTIDPEDVGYSSERFQILFDVDEETQIPIHITLGKVKTTFVSKYRVAYYPIYLVSKDETVKYCIGLFELEENKVIQTELKELQNPLYFSFAKEIITQEYNVKNTKNDDEEDKLILDENDENVDDEMPSVLDTNQFLKEIRQEGIFTVELNQHIMYLPVEIKEEADEIVRSYSTVVKQENAHREQIKQEISWVEQFFKNQYYRIHSCEENGDSLFAVVHDAFQNIGYITNVSKLRHLIAKRTTTAHYQYYFEKANLLKTFLNSQRNMRTSQTRKVGISINRKKTSTSIENYFGYVVKEI